MQEEQGFVLATSLVMLLLLTLLTSAVYISVDSSQKSSGAAESATEAFYYAETAANYMSWSLYNNVEFDSYTYPQPVRTDLAGLANNKFGEPDMRPALPNQRSLPNPLAAGDFAEWFANPGNPSGEQLLSFGAPLILDPYGVQATTVDHYGQLMYYDNSAWDSRMVFLWSSDMYSQGGIGLPDLYKIHERLPRYIMLSIDDYGNITPSMPPYTPASPNHHASDQASVPPKSVKGVDYPENGAIVWLTGGNQTDDYVIDPTDHYFAHIFHYTNPLNIATRVNDPYGEYRGASAVAHGNYALVNGVPRVDIYGNLKRLLCDPAIADKYSTACAIKGPPYTGAWLRSTNYGLVIYSIGYAQGRASKLIRMTYR
jgi:hypothetical protein